MTKEELIKLSRENLRKSKQGSLCECYDEAFIKGYELSEKRIAELEEKLTEKVTLESLDVVSGKITELEEAKANLEYLLEGRDNEITDLEKKNKVLAQNLEDTEIINNTLEKENAELKERLKEHESIGNAQFWENVWSWKTKAKQLTKAKELLKKLLVHSKRYIWIADDNNKPIMQKEIAEAEQFLNSEVEK